MAERRRKGPPAAGRAAKAAPPPPAPPPPGRPFSAREQALLFGAWPELSGSASGAFTYGLYCQVVRALCHNAQDDPETVDVARIAARRFMAGVAPRDPVEGMMAVQLLGLHDAAMECFRRGALREQPGEYRDQNLTQANRLVRSYAVLLEALDRRRGKGQPQVVRVERVTVEAGGRAIVGAVTQGGGGSGAGSDGRPHAPAALAHEPGVPLRCADPEGEPVPVARGAGQAAVPDARRCAG
jgi:hypothetical protein